MLCNNCSAKLSYGEKYCNKCGEEISKEVYEEEYNDSVWAKLDKAQEVYDTLFLKKITGSIIFKVISLAVVLSYFFFTMNGNLTGIRLKENTEYKIEYNKQYDEYYISLNQDNANLEIFVPFGTDEIVFKAVNSDEKSDVTQYSVEEYKNNGYEIRENSYEYITIETVRKEKKTDIVKIIVVSK